MELIISLSMGSKPSPRNDDLSVLHDQLKIFLLSKSRDVASKTGIHDQEISPFPLFEGIPSFNEY